MAYILVAIAVIANATSIILMHRWAVKELRRKHDQIVNLAKHYVELEEKVNNVDMSLGKEISTIGLEFETFKNLYGEAAIEEKREAAKAEKAWADGLNSIMSYGGRLQGRGDKG